MNTLPSRPVKQAAQPSPARLTAEATIKLPRWALIALCLLYILPGLIGRDPWKSEDAAAFGAMWTMADAAGHGGAADWLVPNVVGAPVVDSGPLMYWVGALCIKAFGALLGPPLAARLATVLFFLMTVTGLWYATVLVNRRPAAQPARLAFGGHPDPKDYARVLADGSLLILLATVGLLVRAHETSSDVAMLAMLSMALYGMARSLDEAKTGAAWIAAALVGLVLSRGPAPALATLVLWIVLVVFHRDFRPARAAAIGVLLPTALVGLAIWPLATWLVLPDADVHLATRLGGWARYFDGIDAQATSKYLHTLPWSTWLAWPLAAWGVWSWRDRLREPHIALPAGFTGAMIAVLCCTSDTSDGQLLLVLPGLVMLAAAGLPTLRRGGANAFDWFSLLLYSVAGLFIWFTWFTKMTGIPAGFARSLVRLTPGATYTFEIAPFILAVAATIAWILIVRWRIVSHPKVLWRSVVLASGGLILAWMLTSTLFLQSIDYSRTYRGVAADLNAALVAAGDRVATRARRRVQPATPLDATAPGGSCVATDGLGLAQRASFAWFGGLHFSRVDDSGNNVDECDYLLRQDQARGVPRDEPAATRWKLLWEGRRPTDRDERFRLYRKTGGVSTRGAGDAIERIDGHDAAPAAVTTTPDVPAKP